MKFDILVEKYKRMAANMSLGKIAKKHDVEISKLKEQLKMGKKVEREHGGNIKKATKIAMDHLAEDPKYYSKLKKAKL